jgi:hypothetical protein
MSMFGGAGLGILGGVMSGVGGYETAQDTKDQATRSKQYDEMQLYGGMARQAFELLGADEGEKWVRANIPIDAQNRLFGTPDFQQQVIPQYTSAGQNNANGIQRLAAKVVQNQGASATGTESPGIFRTVKGIKGQYDINALKANAGQGSLAQIGNLAEQQIARDNAVANAQEGLVAQSRGYGNAMRAQINRDSAQQLAQLNALTGAQARAAGIFGGSYQGQQNAANAANIFRAKTDALTGLNMAEQNRTLGLQQGALNTQLQNAGTATNLRLQPINARMAAMQGSIFNPYLSRSSTSYFPGVSPGGNLLQGVGNSLSGQGGIMQGQQNTMGQIGAMSGGGSLGGYFG